MTHSIPEESIALKGVVKMTEIEVEETKARNRKSENRNQKPEVEVEELKETCVMCHDKNREIFNKRSKTCRHCYQAWRRGRKEHPTLGKFTPSQVHHQPKRPGRDGPIITLNLNDCPKIIRRIDFLADKYLVNPEHVIIGLLGEALAARKERGLLNAET